MPFSYAVTTLVSETDTVSVPFPYLSRAHVKLTTDGDPVPQNSFTWIDDATFTLPNPLDVGTVVRVYRETPNTNMLVSFEAGLLDHKDLNRANKQLLFVAQEAIDAMAVATEVAESILDYVEEVEDIRDQVVTLAGNLATLELTYDIAASVPYLVSDNEYILGHKLMADVAFTGPPFARSSLFSNSGDVSGLCAFQVLVRSGDPLVDGQVLATGSITNGNSIGSFVTGLTGGQLPYLLPAGTIIAVKVVDIHASLTNFSIAISLSRTDD